MVNNDVLPPQSLTPPEQVEKPSKQLNWMQKIALKSQLKKLKRKLSDEIIRDKKDEHEQRKKLIQALLEMNGQGLDIIEVECECGVKDCELKGVGHKKQERPSTKEDLEAKQTIELERLLFDMLEEVKAVI